MELFLLGVVVGVVGARGKRILKPIAHGYLELTDRAREFGAELRENFEDALAEARYEREKEAAERESGAPDAPGADDGAAQPAPAARDGDMPGEAEPAAASRGR
jgi:hypothetical protein